MPVSAKISLLASIHSSMLWGSASICEIFIVGERAVLGVGGGWGVLPRRPRSFERGVGKECVRLGSIRQLL